MKNYVCAIWLLTSLLFVFEGCKNNVPVEGKAKEQRTPSQPGTPKTGDTETPASSNSTASGVSTTGGTGTPAPASPAAPGVSTPVGTGTLASSSAAPSGVPIPGGIVIPVPPPSPTASGVPTSGEIVIPVPPPGLPASGVPAFVGIGTLASPSPTLGSNDSIDLAAASLNSAHGGDDGLEVKAETTSLGTTYVETNQEPSTQRSRAAQRRSSQPSQATENSQELIGQVNQVTGSQVDAESRVDRDSFKGLMNDLDPDDKEAIIQRLKESPSLEGIENFEEGRPSHWNILIGIVEKVFNNSDQQKTEPEEEGVAASKSKNKRRDSQTQKLSAIKKVAQEVKERNANNKGVEVPEEGTTETPEDGVDLTEGKSADK